MTNTNEPRETTPPKDAAIKRADARRIIDHGGTVYAVAEANTFRLFDNAAMARRWADKLGVTHVLDWETGEYADA